jgi:hypothetical protein
MLEGLFLAVLLDVSWREQGNGDRRALLLLCIYDAAGSEFITAWLWGPH